MMVDKAFYLTTLKETKPQSAPRHAVWNWRLRGGRADDRCDL
ncbi:MAG: hypothetical protein WCI73_01105 [Phycisphaerae bacterium]